MNRKTFTINTSFPHKDNELIRRWQDGDEKAFKEFYLAHLEEMLRLALNKVHLLHAAEELVQDAFMDFYMSRNKIKDTPAAYLKTILRNKVYDFYHKKNSVVLQRDLSDNIHYDGQTAFDMLSEKELNKSVHAHIDELPEQCRRVFLMSRSEALSNKEIAEKLNISVKAVEANITRALKYLREHLDHQLFWLMIWYWMK